MILLTAFLKLGSAPRKSSRDTKSVKPLAAATIRAEKPVCGDTKVDFSIKSIIRKDIRESNL